MFGYSHHHRVEEAAHEAATSPLNTHPQPTPAQQKAGNYRKGHVRLHGLEISIENSSWSTRSGVGDDGKVWSVMLLYHYGYICGTVGADGDQVDVIIGAHPESERVWVVDQVKRDGTFDEHKVILGAESETEARETYLANYAPGWTGLGAITELTLERFKEWVFGTRTSEPLATTAPPPSLFLRAATLIPSSFLLKARSPKDNPENVLGKDKLQRGHWVNRGRAATAAVPKEVSDRWPAVEASLATSIASGELDVITDLKELRRRAREIYAKLTSATNRRTGRVVQFNHKAFKETQSHSANRRVMDVTPSLPELVENAHYLYSEPNRGGEKGAWHTYATKGTLRGESVYVRLTTREVEGRETLSHYDTNVITEPQMQQALHGGRTRLTMPGTRHEEPVDEEILTTIARASKLRAGGLHKADVLNPGSHGSTRWYVDDQGKVRYGEPPAGATAFHGAVTRKQTAVITARKSQFLAGRAIRSAAAAAEIFRDAVDRDRERFWALHLNNRHRAVAVECVSLGSLTATIVHPREVFKNAVQLQTKALAFVHNHPSGDPTPSREDMDITRRLVEVGGTIGIPVLHHVVVGFNGWSEVGVNAHEEWHPPAPGRRRNLPEVQGRLVRRAPEQELLGGAQIFGAQIRGSGDVYAVGKRLLDPGDRVALALSLDNKHRVIGVFAIGHEQIDGTTAAQFSRTTIGAGAAAAVIVASKDGDQWQRGVASLHTEVKSLSEVAGVRYLDTVSVGDGAYRSASDNDSVIW